MPGKGCLALNKKENLIKWVGIKGVWGRETVPWQTSDMDKKTVSRAIL